MRFIATITTIGGGGASVTGGLFDTAGGAWTWLADQRLRQEEEAAGVPQSETLRAPWHLRLADVDEDISDTVEELEAAVGVGTVYGWTPGYDGDHDPGLAYSVSVAVEEDVMAQTTTAGQSPDEAELQTAVDAVNEAAMGDSNDDEIERLQEALELALVRWPAVDANRPVPKKLIEFVTIFPEVDGHDEDA